MFLSQLPYVPLGDLRAVVCYPPTQGVQSDDEIRSAARQRRARASGRPARRGGRLGQGALPGRAAARRVRPRPADQAEGGLPRRGTSALDEGQEFALYQLLRTELPDCIVVSVSHRPTVEQHHDTPAGAARRWHGAWRAGRAGPNAPRCASPRALRRGGRRTSPRPAACRWRSPCRPGRCWRRRRPPHTGPGITLPSVAQHLAVDGHRQPAHGEAGVHRPAQRQVERRPRSFVLWRKVFRLLVEVGVLALARRTRCIGPASPPGCPPECPARPPSPRRSPSRR